MCGITGIWSTTHVNTQDAAQMTQRLSHRGPDAQAVYITPDQAIALGHRRLSVIDLSDSANQPMHSANGRYVIVFNGEIYNYVALRRELMQLGFQFKTSSDTEVLLVAFEKWGSAVLNRLEGMFALAILDQQLNKIFLARDRVGKKPLYYYCSAGMFLFASEPKAIVGYPGCKLRINTDALYDFLQVGYIPAPLTPWLEMRKLPAGCWAEVNSPSEIKVHEYWNVIAEVPYQIENSPQGVATQFHNLLSEAVAKRLRSDVPLGALLSGGTDSSLVCAIANEQLNGKLKTFNIGFDDQKFDERQYADAVAKMLGTEHYSFTLSSADSLHYVEEYLTHFDEPFADTSAIPTMMVSKKTREQVTVSLTGDGGDELFLGYGSYRWAERLRSWKYLGKPLSGMLKRLPAPLSKAGEMFDAPIEVRQHLFSVEQGFFSRQELTKIIAAPYKKFAYTTQNITGKTEAEQQALFDFNYYLKDDLLVKVDRASMRYALECRCPLLDHKVVEFVTALPVQFKIQDGVQKYLPKKALEAYLPKDLIYRKKWGFSVPLEKWLRTELKYLIDTYLSDAVLSRHGLVNAAEVKVLVKRFQNGESRLYHRIWVLVVLHYWLHIHAA